MEFAAGSIEGELLLVGLPTGYERPAFVIDRVGYDLSHRTLPQAGRLVQAGDDFTAEKP